MVPGVRRAGDPGQRRSAQYARQRREELGLTQADIATAAGVRDVKTVRNFETGRNWPNDLTRRGIEAALRIKMGTLDDLADGGEGTGEVEPPGPARVGAQLALPSAQELIDLSSAISRLLEAQQAMLARGDSHRAEQVRTLISAINDVMVGYRSGLEEAATDVRGQDSAGRGPSHADGRPSRPDRVEGQHG